MNQLARSVLHHKKLPKTEEARRRSGQSRGEHGLTVKEWRDRESKRIAERHYYRAEKLHFEDLASWGYYQRASASQGKGKGKKRDHRGRGVTEHSYAPRRFEHMQSNEQTLVSDFRNGRLYKTMQAARAKRCAVQAPRFAFLTD